MTAVRDEHAHDPQAVRGTTWTHGEPRCIRCGHRMAVNGIEPVRTLRRPPWRWLPEILRRRAAGRIGKAALAVLISETKDQGAGS